LILLLAVSLAGNVFQWMALTVPDAASRPQETGNGLDAQKATSAPRISGAEPVSAKRKLDSSRVRSPRHRELEQLARTDPLAALATVDAEFDGNERLSMVAVVIGIWAETRPNEAADWLSSAVERLVNDEAVQSLIQSWVLSAPDAAAQWVGSLDPSQRAGAAELLATLWAADDGAAATRWAAAASADADLGVTFHIALEAWIEADPQAARRQLDRLGDPAITLEAHRVFGALTATMDAAAAWDCVSGLNEPSIRNAAALAVVESLADVQPAKTAVVVRNESDEFLRAEMTRALIAKWAYSDLRNASKWLESLPTGSSREAGIATIAEQLESSDPKTSLAWAMRLVSQDERLKAVESAFFQLAENDLEAARSWVRQTDLPDDLKNLEQRLPVGGQ
jgi:hypothetical protein